MGLKCSQDRSIGRHPFTCCTSTCPSLEQLRHQQALPKPCPTRRQPPTQTPAAGTRTPRPSPLTLTRTLSASPGRALPQQLRPSVTSAGPAKQPRARTACVRSALTGAAAAAAAAAVAEAGEGNEDGGMPPACGCGCGCGFSTRKAALCCSGCLGGTSCMWHSSCTLYLMLASAGG